MATRIRDHIISKSPDIHSPVDGKCSFRLSFQQENLQERIAPVLMVSGPTDPLKDSKVMLFCSQF
jgi:hypothetical protein